MHRQSGFTIAELLIALAMLTAASLFVYSQWQYTAAAERDSDRKIAINAIDAYLQEVYLATNNEYPLLLDPKAITAINEDELRDPSGRPVTDFRSDLRYEPGNCTENACQRYTLRAALENEADFIRRGTVD